MSTSLKVIGKAIGQRASGSKPGVPRALSAATIVGVGAGALAYRLLRGGS